MAGDAGGGVPPKSDPYEACAVERIEKSRGNACAMFSGHSPAISDIAIFHLTSRSLNICKGRNKPCAKAEPVPLSNPSRFARGEPVPPHEASVFAKGGTGPVRRRNRFPFINLDVLRKGNRFPLMKPQYLRKAEQALCEGGTGSLS